MALYQTTPKNIRLKIPVESQPLFADFNTLCVITNRRPIDYITDLVRDEVVKNHHLLKDSWLTWEEFRNEMRKHGYTLNRQTIFNYRKQDAFGDLIKSDGVSTRYNLEGILRFLQEPEDDTR